MLIVVRELLSLVMTQAGELTLKNLHFLPQNYRIAPHFGTELTLFNFSLKSNKELFFYEGECLAFFLHLWKLSVRNWGGGIPICRRADKLKHNKTLTERSNKKVSVQMTWTPPPPHLNTLRINNLKEDSCGLVTWSWCGIESWNIQNLNRRIKKM